MRSEPPPGVPQQDGFIPPQADPRDVLDVTVAGSDDRGVVLVVQGEVDMHTGAVLREAVDSVLAGAPRRIVLDLQQVDFFSSVGLSALVDLHRAAGIRRIALRLVADGRAVLRPLEAVGLAGHFTRCASVEEALDSPFED